ncbi:MAG: DUF234 domain-containing protein [Aigarchaeota archaeon]|nr:DUF234 domain-containing protein [Candidatus Pelearchaeum maunauluense]
MKNLPTYLGHVFEKLCLEIVSLVLTGYKIGRYWDRHGNEIDIVALGDEKALFFECKLTEPDKSDAKLLQHKSKMMAEKLSVKYGEEYFIVPEKEVI